MFEFHEKRKVKSILYSKPFLVGMCIPIFFLSFAAFKAHKKEQETSQKREELTADLSTLEYRASKLEEDIKNLDDPRGIEKELRSRYEVGKDGEEIIVFVEDKKPEKKEGVVEEKKGFWSKIIDFVLALD